MCYPKSARKLQIIQVLIFRKHWQDSVVVISELESCTVKGILRDRRFEVGLISCDIEENISPSRFFRVKSFRIRHLLDAAAQSLSNLSSYLIAFGD